MRLLKAIALQITSQTHAPLPPSLSSSSSHHTASSLSPHHNNPNARVAQDLLENTKHILSQLLTLSLTSSLAGVGIEQAYLKPRQREVASALLACDCTRYLTLLCENPMLRNAVVTIRIKQSLSLSLSFDLDICVLSDDLLMITLCSIRSSGLDMTYVIYIYICTMGVMYVSM